MPRGLVHRNVGVGQIDDQEIGRLADVLRVNESALIEHLHNLDLIDEGDRDRLRNSGWRSRPDYSLEQ